MSKKKNCERHGDGNACRAYHTGSKRKCPCEMEKNHSWVKNKNIGVVEREQSFKKM